jgi:hypothetical protein
MLAVHTAYWLQRREAETARKLKLHRTRDSSVLSHVIVSGAPPIHVSFVLLGKIIITICLFSKEITYPVEKQNFHISSRPSTFSLDDIDIL